VVVIVKSFIIIGTAGHVDHGKTELVKALTGVDTDRLKEEKERGISIDLGFAPLHLPGGILAGVVDVPGHERFVKNMLAGAGGVDLVILVVAADEGVMPQTREHLDILQLLHVQKGVIAITKVDLVDEEWLMLVEEEVRELLKGTRLEGAPMVPVSVVTGQGLEELRQHLAQMAKEVEPKPVSGPARLPIDRVFSISGFGTVVTGTLFSGKIKLGDVVEILPQGVQVRVRSLQVHGQKVEEACAGQRVAVNLTGVEVHQISRGDVLVTPDAFVSEKRLTAFLHLLPRVNRNLENWQRVRFHLATKETFGRVRLLDHQQLRPGENGFVQIELEEPVVAAVGDRFVLRAYSPVTTIGGGEIIEIGGLRYRRFRTWVIEHLERKMSGAPEDKIAEELQRLKRPVTVKELATRTGMNDEEVKEITAGMEKSGKIGAFEVSGEVFLVSVSRIREWQETAVNALKEYHQHYPLRAGMPKEELRTRFFDFLPPRFYQLLLEAWVKEGVFVFRDQAIALPDFSASLTQEQERILEKLLAKFQENPFAPPNEEEVMALLGKEGSELLQYALQKGFLVKLGEGLYFSKEAISRAWGIIENHLQQHQEITVAQARDLLETSRRYCIPLLEYFDREKKTRRIGDKRVLYKAKASN
jgi:selenocysteine-specific elongation factor